MDRWMAGVGGWPPLSPPQVLAKLSSVESKQGISVVSLQANHKPRQQSPASTRPFLSPHLPPLSLHPVITPELSQLSVPMAGLVTDP